MALKFLQAHPLSKPQDGPVSRYLNRYLSSPISELLLKTNVTPNQISIAISLLSIPILWLGIYGHIALVGFFLQFASILDGVDGEIARAKKLNTSFGGLLDTVLDYWIDSVGILAIGLALLKRHMLSADFVLLLVALTIAIRLISQFVVKNIPNTKAHIYGDTRDVVTLLIFLGTASAEILKNPLGLLVILVLINIWRLDNMFYRLFVFWRLGNTPKTKWEAKGEGVAQ